MKRVLIILLAAVACMLCEAQEIEKIDKFPTGYINGTYMNKYKSIDGYSMLSVMRVWPIGFLCAILQGVATRPIPSIPIADVLLVVLFKGLLI